MAATIFERRSINFFDTTKSVSDELLKSIIDLAVTAPSAFNLQPWGLIAVKSDEAKKRLHSLAMNQDKVLEAPVSLLVLGDREGYSSEKPVWQELAKVMGAGVDGAKQMAAQLYGSTEERKVKFAESNAGLLAMSIMYAAKHYGVDTHPMSGIDFEGIKKAFPVDDDMEVVMVITLGYFDESKELWPRGYRKSYDQLLKSV